MSRRRNLFLCSVRMIGELHKDVLLFTHDQALKRYPSYFPCCRKWDKKTRKFAVTQNPCETGAHDTASSTVLVPRVNKTRPFADKLAQPPHPLFMFIECEGELARMLKATTVGTFLYLEGTMHVKRCRKPGVLTRFYNTLDVTTLLPIDKDQIRSEESRAWIAGQRGTAHITVTTGEQTE